MNKYERIKELRTSLHLSQDYVSRFLKIDRSDYAKMENGNQEISKDVAIKISDLFGVCSEDLMNPVNTRKRSETSASSFHGLDEKDQTEIRKLIQFKEQIKAQRNELPYAASPQRIAP